MAPAAAPPHQYLIALGSNVRHARHGAPAQVLRGGARARRCGPGGEGILADHRQRAARPSRRRYANACA
jgi:2-amino-4-hydroxy-6-hydroxymethyldihydropteridine diphosphokinase